ncbi:hypothetical protein SAMN05216499_11986 [Actinacidiphila paucisporea]|uniref:Uncharacterized protein n=1 Tax=Actinacidiphila paucisporea TaxID=310782 RepID=A0A1M7NPD0_9ACTN|nr:hypothetical protein SAMN05216499_11986 [Actinacidiphila paucisporea]
MTSGDSRHAGQGRFAATPKGMWWASLGEIRSHLPGSKTSGRVWPVAW